MKKTCFLLTLFFAYSTASAEVPSLLKCRVKNSEWAALFTLNSAETGTLQFIKSGDKNSYTCELKADDLYNGRRAVVSNLTVRFERGYCNPELGDLEKEVFDDFTLIVERPNNSPTGVVQWLKKKQPDPCSVEKLNLAEFAQQAKKSGRKTASEPKKKR